VRTWLPIKPPTCLYIAVDPEGRYFTPANVPQIGWRSLDEIRAVLRAQGVTAADPAEVDALVRIRTWSESCHEFAHFTDDELADGVSVAELLTEPSAAAARRQSGYRARRTRPGPPAGAARQSTSDR